MAKDVVYQNYCEQHDLCNGKYDGETSEVIKERFGEHLDDYRLRPQKSVMHAHSIEHHNGTKVDFKVKILGTCVGDPLLRQCMEAVAIRDDKPSMNRKEEWGTNKNNNPKLTTKKQTENTDNTLKSRRKSSKEKVPMTPPKPQVQQPATKKQNENTDSALKSRRKSSKEEVPMTPPKPRVQQPVITKKIACWKCNLVCKDTRGLKIHQRTCLQKATSGTSFLQDERFELNQRRNERRELRGMKILPPSQPLRPLTSNNEDNATSDRRQCRTLNN